MTKLESTTITQEELSYCGREFTTTVEYIWDGATPYVMFTQEAANANEDQDVVIMTKADFLRIADMVRGH